MTRHYKSKRVAARPCPASWGDDELLTFSEAAELFWPDGPISTSTLRTAARGGILEIAVIAGKFFTTKRALTLMGRCRPQAKPDETNLPRQTTSSTATTPPV